MVAAKVKPLWYLDREFFQGGVQLDSYGTPSPDDLVMSTFMNKTVLVWEPQHIRYVFFHGMRQDKGGTDRLGSCAGHGEGASGR